jgi:Pvc16 N-terminal domain
LFIKAIDQGLERLLRTQLPLPEDAGDVSFAIPSIGWGERVGRPTVNLFLYEVKPSARPSPSIVRRDMDGRPQQRRPSPVLELNYLVSAWAKSPLAEHKLLGEVVSRLSVQGSLPSAQPADEGGSPAQLIFGGDVENNLRDIWSAAGGRLKASFTLSVVTATDTFPWTDQAPLVTEVVRGVSRRP